METRILYLREVGIEIDISKNLGKASSNTHHTRARTRTTHITYININTDILGNINYFMYLTVINKVTQITPASDTSRTDINRETVF